jgi:hypothetical protein
MVHPRSRNSIDAFVVPPAEQKGYGFKGSCANITGAPCHNGQVRACAHYSTCRALPHARLTSEYFLLAHSLTQSFNHSIIHSFGRTHMLSRSAPCSLARTHTLSRCSLRSCSHSHTLSRVCTQLTLGQAAFWYSQGCFIGCPECDHVSGRRQTDICKKGFVGQLPTHAIAVNGFYPNGTAVERDSVYECVPTNLFASQPACTFIRSLLYSCAHV